MDAARILTLSQMAELACAMEVMCPKPGNVSPGKPFTFINDLSFIASAIGVASVFDDKEASVGQMVENAVTITKKLVDKNTNLGIILLLAPLVKAAHVGELHRQSVQKELLALGDDDSRQIYDAINIASPEGLGKSEKYDVHEPPPPIMKAMELAACWDSIAREYATHYKITFELTLPWLVRFWHEGHSLKNTILQTYLLLLSTVPDTLISRKLGVEMSRKVSGSAQKIVEAGGVFTSEGKNKIYELEVFLADPDNLLNPGTTADLIAAGIFVFLEKELKSTQISHLLERWDIR